MKICFLAAGKSSRIYKKINKPKCLIKINQNTLIVNLIKNTKNLNINKKYIVLGFQKKKIIQHLSNLKNINFIINKKYNSHDMLHSIMLFLKKNADDDVIISYSDVYYDKSVLSKLIQLKNKNITLPILCNWKKIWNFRKKKIEDDGETLKINRGGYLTEIGEKIYNKKINYQFMGIILIPKIKIKSVLDAYKKIKSKKMQTTKFLNLLIKRNIKIRTIKYKKFWFEFDDFEDIKGFNNIKKKIKL